MYPQYYHNLTYISDAEDICDWIPTCTAVLLVLQLATCLLQLYYHGNGSTGTAVVLSRYLSTFEYW